ILLIGALLFTFFALKPAPIYFNERSFQLLESQFPQDANALSEEHNRLQEKQMNLSTELLKEREMEGDLQAPLAEYKIVQQEIKDLHREVEKMINEKKISYEKTDTNYIFLYFVKNTLPV